MRFPCSGNLWILPFWTFIQGVVAMSVLAPHQLSTGVPQGWVLGPLFLMQLLGQTMVMSCTGNSDKHVCVWGSCFRWSRMWLRVSSSTNQRGSTSAVLMGLHWPPVAADIMLPLTGAVHDASCLLRSTHERRLSKPPVGAQQSGLSSHLVPWWWSSVWARATRWSFKSCWRHSYSESTCSPNSDSLSPPLSPGYTSLHSLSTALLQSLVVLLPGLLRLVFYSH